MQRYSLASVIRRALGGNQHWQPVWRDAQPHLNYEAVIIGGGGHGLATAYYLAKNQGLRRIAVLERGWIGSGNSCRNTQVVRSNYFYPQSAAFYDHSLRLYQRLSRELNFNIMLSQRGLVALAHSEHELELAHRLANAMRMNGVEAQDLTAQDVHELVPLLNTRPRFPILGGVLQQRAGISRHDAVVWGYARAASDLGVDIIQNCEVTDFNIAQNSVIGVRTSRGSIAAGRVVMSVAAHSSQLGQRAGLRLPITTMPLQAMVTEPIKPVLDKVVTSAAIHCYVSQSDRGEIVIGGGADAYNSYAQRGSLAVLRSTLAALLELFPAFSRLRLMRQWAGSVDITPDASPLMGLTPVRNLYINCGWGTGGYKAIPAGGETMADTVAHDRPHPLIAPFSLERFREGALIDEGAAAGVAH